MNTYLINSSQISDILETLNNRKSLCIDGINNRCLSDKGIELLAITPVSSIAISPKTLKRLKLSQLGNLVS